MDQKFVIIEKTKVNEVLYNFVNNEIIPETSINKDSFWRDFIIAANILAIKNKTLIKERDVFQKKLMLGMLKIKINLVLSLIKIF